MSTIELADPELRDALALWPLLDVYDDGQGVVGRDRAIGQNADRLCAKRALDMDLVGGDIGRFGFGTVPISSSALARCRVKDIRRSAACSDGQLVDLFDHALDALL